MVTNNEESFVPTSYKQPRMHQNLCHDLLVKNKTWIAKGQVIPESIFLPMKKFDEFGIFFKICT